MLEFNTEHKIADLSTIKEKTDRAKKSGKVKLCGIALSAVILLSGCGSTVSNTNNKVDTNQSTITATDVNATAIILENGNAVVVDLKSYSKYIDSRGSIRLDVSANDKTWILYTTSGEKILVDFNSVQIIDGNNSHDKAEFIAQSLVGENGKVTCYDEDENYIKTK